MKCLIAFLILVGCQTHSGWHYHHIPSKEKACTRLLYSTEDPVRGIDVEFLYSGEELVAYLQVHSHPLVSEGEKRVAVCLMAEDKVLEFLADLHVGKQRVRLSKNSLSELVKFLKEGKSVTIKLKGYQQTLDPNRFETEFHKLKSPPFQVPFHLPI